MAGPDIFTLKLLLVATALTFLPATTANRSLFGEACNKTVKCDSGAWLGCFDGTCSCLKQNEMLYDKTSSKCVSKAGERCKYAVDNPDTSTEDDTKTLIFEVTNCVANATCSSEGICVCESRFHENVTGLCTLSQGYLDHCDIDHKCSHYEALECSSKDSLCHCNHNNSVYSHVDNQCVGLGNHSCINSKCIDYATCHQQNQNPTDGTCKCEKGYYLDEVGSKCYPKIGPLQHCNADYQCESKPGLELLCINNLCNCNPNSSRYATAQKADRYRFDPDIFNGFIGPGITQCVGLAGSKCIDRLCVPRAYCSYNFANDFSGLCKCMSGYRQTKLGRCGHDYMEPCDSGDSCLDGLVCNNKHCVCKYSNQVYDTYGKTCYSKVWGPCNNRTIPCGTNAECKLFHVSNSSSLTIAEEGAKEQQFDSAQDNYKMIPLVSGHCQCQDGYVENLDGACEVAYGGPCDSTTDCDSVSGLQCINSVCQCGSFGDYHAELRKCVGLVGAKCSINLEIECVPNAHCAFVHAKLPGVCTCNHYLNFTETYDYHCSKGGV